MWWRVSRMRLCWLCFFCKQRTAYAMRISDWSSDVCSSDLLVMLQIAQAAMDQLGGGRGGGAGEIDAFGKDHRQTATGSIAGDAGAVHAATDDKERSEERRVGKRVSVRGDLGGCRIMKKKHANRIVLHAISYTQLHTI